MRTPPTAASSVNGSTAPKPAAVKHENDSFYLSSSFSGSPRFLKERKDNSLHLVNRKGMPLFFITAAAPRMPPPPTAAPTMVQKPHKCQGQTMVAIGEDFPSRSAAPTMVGDKQRRQQEHREKLMVYSLSRLHQKHTIHFTFLSHSPRRRP